MTATTERNEPEGNGCTLLGVFLWGALAGAATALLFAPARGSETRARLEASAREGREQARLAFERGKATVGRTRERLQDQAQHATQVAEEARRALSDIRERGEDALENIRREAARAIADAKAAYHEVRAGLDRPPGSPS